MSERCISQECLETTGFSYTLSLISGKYKMTILYTLMNLESSVLMMYIRDLLGHSSVTTTEIYARTDANLKRKAIEAASKEIVPSEEASWDTDIDLKEWLKSFNKR